MRQTTRGSRHLLNSRCLRLAAFAALAGAAALGSSEATAQRADCGVVGPAANVVCSNPELAGLARETQDAFREVVRTTAREDRPAIMRDQRDWSLTLGQCLSSTRSDECLRLAFEERISALAGQASGQVGETLTVAPPPPVEQRELPAPEGATPSPAFSEGAGEPLAEDRTPTASGPGEEDLGAERGSPGPGETLTAARTPSTSEPPEESETTAILTATVWKAEIASGIRPGTIFVFNGDGGLVTADCVESYRLGTWQVSADGALVMNEGNAASQTAEIIGIRDNFIRLQIKDAGDGPGRTLVLRPAVAPFSCKSG